MTTVIYADSLMIVNFSMDFLSLFICARLMHFPLRPIRIAAAALIGAFYALLATIISSRISLGVLEFIFSAVCAYIMTLCAFGGSPAANLRSTAAYLAVNISLGGLMTALFSYLSKLSVRLGLQRTTVSTDASPVAFILIAGISAAVSLIYGRMKERSFTRKKVSARLIAFERENTVTLLSDSGNLLTDPFTKKPVIVLSAKRMDNLLPSYITEAAYTKKLHSESFSPNGIRLIPANSVNGSGILIGFVPVSIVIEGAPIDAVVALDPKSEGYDGCDGIVSQSLLNT